MNMEFKRSHEIMNILFVFFAAIFKRGEAQYAVRPTNSITMNGSSIILNCAALQNNEDVMWYEYITNPTGVRISYNSEVVHPNEGKYEIIGHYDLLINKTYHFDAGTYSCRLAGAGTTSYIELFVTVDNRVRCAHDFTEYQRSTLYIVHGFIYGISIRSKDLRVIGLSDMSGLEQNRHNYFDIGYSAYLNTTLRNHQNEYSCVVTFWPPSSRDIPPDSEVDFYDRSPPGMLTYCTGTINVQYLVRDICIIPNLAENIEVTVGNVITCNASGNPTPRVRWYNVHGPEMTQDGDLHLTEDMIGTNHTYECVAYNTVNNKAKTITQRVTFYTRNVSDTSIADTHTSRTTCTPREIVSTTSSPTSTTREIVSTTSSPTSTTSTWKRWTPAPKTSTAPWTMKRIENGIIIGSVCGVIIGVTIVIIIAAVWIHKSNKVGHKSKNQPGISGSLVYVASENDYYTSVNSSDGIGNTSNKQPEFETCEETSNIEDRHTSM